MVLLLIACSTTEVEEATTGETISDSESDIVSSILPSSTSVVEHAISRKTNINNIDFFIR